LIVRKQQFKMGTSSSKEAAFQDTSNANTNGRSRLDSDDDDDDARDDCTTTMNNCFSFCKPGGGGSAKGSSKKKKDFLGTPIPDTPINQRMRRRLLIQETEREEQQERRSSKYFGLEKEQSTRTSISTLLDDYERRPSAVVHQGKDSEKELHDKYELKEVLGVGSTSTVHRCIQRSTNLSFACKIIDKKHIESRFNGMLEQFHREITALRSLKHPNIIRLLDVYVSDDKIFIIMEQMEGGELFDYVVEKGTLNEEEAARIVRKVTSALVYMHSKNIIHRDLKPENLLLRNQPKSPTDVEVKIIDFGLSKCMVEPVASSFLGTRGYLAPEMLQRRDYSRAVDTWALGVIAFVLLCGCLPFDDDSQTVPSDALVRSKFVLRFPRWANNLSDSAKDLLSHLLDINPRTRFTAEQALSHPWVEGKTAPADSLLQSPGRIKITTPGKGNPHAVVTVKAHRAAANLISPSNGARKRTLVRKKSI